MAEVERREVRGLERPRVVRASEQTSDTVQTGGMARFEALHTDRLWAGIARNAPHAASGWHHHGDRETAIYVVQGGLRLESGPDGREVHEAGPGDWVFVPAGEVHRETNPSDGEAVIAIVRAGRGEIVVNVQGPGSGAGSGAGAGPGSRPGPGNAAADHRTKL